MMQFTVADTDETVQTARRWLERQCDGPECRVCGTDEGTAHDPTDVCGIIAALLFKLTGAQAWPAPPRPRR